MKNQFNLEIKNPSSENAIQFKATSKQRRSIRYFAGISILFLSFFTFGTLQAQVTKENSSEVKTSIVDKNLKVNGTILDEDGLPLAAASVILKGTTKGTSTNSDGYFEFPGQLKKDDVLLISYVGYATQKVVISNEESASNIELKIAMNMTDVVIVAKAATHTIFKSNRK